MGSLRTVCGKVLVEYAVDWVGLRGVNKPKTTPNNHQKRPERCLKGTQKGRDERRDSLFTSSSVGPRSPKEANTASSRRSAARESGTDDSTVENSGDYASELLEQ